MLILAYLILKDIVMLCVWPEVVQTSHWLSNVRFDSVYENFLLKKIMLDIINRVFLNLSRKHEVISYSMLKCYMLYIRKKTHC